MKLGAFFLSIYLFHWGLFNISLEVKDASQICKHPLKVVMHQITVLEISLQSMYTLYIVHTYTQFIYIFHPYLIGYDFVRAMYIVITNKITMNRFQIDFRPKWTDLLAYQTAPIINITDAIIILQFAISIQRSDWDVKSAYFMLNDELSSFFFKSM